MKLAIGLPSGSSSSRAMQLGVRIRRALVRIFRGRRGTRAPTNDAPRIHSPVAFEALPPEVLHHIFRYVSDEWKDIRLPSVSQLASPFPKGTSAPLIALSAVNKHLRALCLRLLFRLIEIDPSDLLPPSTILPYVRCMHVNPPDTSNPWAISDDFMLQMCRLEEVYWHGEGTQRQAPLSHLRLILTSPTLHSLTLSNVWLLADTTDWTAAASGLRTLRIDFSHQVENRSESDPEFIEAHLACFHSILDILRPRLESLTLSGYSVSLSSLAAAPWPSLRIFSLTRGDAILDVPWAAVLSQMPSLTSFTLALDRGETPAIIFPDAASAQCTALSTLRHFTVSFPHPEDPVFSILPSDIRELSLRDTPRYYTFRKRWRQLWNTEPILSSPDVLRIFTALTATNLSALELVYLEDHEELSMLAFLSQSCPNLTLLELHRYPATPSRQDAWYHGTLSIPVHEIADALAGFKSLRILKLNLRFTDYEVSRHEATIPVDYWERLAEYLNGHAYDIALRVPWIEMLSLLAWSRRLMCWYTWSVLPGDSAETVRVDYEDIYFDSHHAYADYDYY